MEELQKILALMGLDKLEKEDQAYIKEKLQTIIESVADEKVKQINEEQHNSLELAERIIQLVEHKTELMFDGETGLNLLPVVNAAKGMSGDNAKLAGIMVAIIAEMTNETEFLQIARQLSTDSKKEEKEVKENMSKLKTKKSIYEVFKHAVENSLTDCKTIYEFIQDSENYAECGLSVYDEYRITKDAGQTEASDVWGWLSENQEPEYSGNGVSEVETINESDKNPFKTDMDKFKAVMAE